MKRIGFFIVVVLCLIMIKFELQAQCGEGFSERIVTMQVGQCQYKVQLCVKCHYSPAVDPEEVKLMGFWKVPTVPECIQTLDYQQIVNYIMSQIQSYDFIRTYVCNSQLNAPPCTQGQLQIKFVQFLCYQWLCQLYFGDIVKRTTPCNQNSWCETTFSYCWNGSIMEKTLVSGPTQIGTPDCELEGWEITIPTVPGTESECFIHHTSCNPL